ncbi:putative nucleoside triphosphate pyrophosphohydrolase [Vibrio phage 168E36-1]|nr:putative nucleoside triphosphate pyrophosphohydrolase [Vibrio phage 168E36-1]
MTQLNKMFDAFNAQYGIETQPLEHKLNGMIQIVGGEFDEWVDEMPLHLFKNEERFIAEPEKFVKEGLDVIYAMTQQLRERGVDVDAGLAEVHRSNMSKTVDFHDLQDEIHEARKRYPDAILIPLDNGRYVIKSPSQGKVVKPTCYSPAVITEAIIKQQ